MVDLNLEVAAGATPIEITGLNVSVQTSVMTTLAEPEYGDAKLVANPQLTAKFVNSESSDWGRVSNSPQIVLEAANTGDIWIQNKPSNVRIATASINDRPTGVKKGPPIGLIIGVVVAVIVIIAIIVVVVVCVVVVRKRGSKSVSSSSSSSDKASKKESYDARVSNTNNNNNMVVQQAAPPPQYQYPQQYEQYPQQYPQQYGQYPQQYPPPQYDQPYDQPPQYPPPHY